MPDKLLKDGLRTSERIGGLTAFAELLFVRLLLATCPLGRCPWSPDWILVHALPNRPHTRLQTITAALEELRSVHLINRYSHDGAAYLTIPNHGQRFRYSMRSPWPAPPEGPPDAEGQTFMALPGGPPLAPPGSSGKKPKAQGGWASPPLFSSTSSSLRDSGDEEPRRSPLGAKAGGPALTKETETAWLGRLAAQYPDVDVVAELREARRKKPRGVERRWFEEHWLPRCSERVGVAASASERTALPEPPGWRRALEELYPDNLINRDQRPWTAVAPGIQAEVCQHITRAA